MGPQRIQRFMYCKGNCSFSEEAASKLRENIHTGRISERVLMSRIYKELKKLNTKLACNQLLKKWSMELNSGALKRRN